MYEFREVHGHDRLGDDSRVAVVAVMTEYLTFLFVLGKAQSAKSKGPFSDVWAQHSFRPIGQKIDCFFYIFVTFSKILRRKWEIEAHLHIDLIM